MGMGGRGLAKSTGIPRDEGGGAGRGARTRGRVTEIPGRPGAQQEQLAKEHSPLDCAFSENRHVRAHPGRTVGTWADQAQVGIVAACRANTTRTKTKATWA